MIHILHPQTDAIIGFLDNNGDKLYWNDKHEQHTDGFNTFQFTIDSRLEESLYVTGRARILIPAERGGYQEFIVYDMLTDTMDKEIFSIGAEAELDKQKIIVPTTHQGLTLKQYVTLAVTDTEYQMGTVEYSGIQTITFDKHVGAYAFLTQVAKDFDIELVFRVETDGNEIIGRYVDVVERMGGYEGKEITYGKDLIGIQKKTFSERIVTALFCIGPVRDDKTRLTTTVTDEDAFQRWGREGKHIFGVYEPESTQDNMTLAQLKQYGETELKKRIDSIDEYTVTGATIESIYPNEKVRLGDSIRIKNTQYQPPLYADARVLSITRSLTDKSNKGYVIGNVITYSEDDILKTFYTLQKKYGLSVIRSEMPPVGAFNIIWVKLDPTALFEIAHSWDGSQWIAIAPKTAEEIGAETPEGSQSTSIEKYINTLMAEKSIVDSKYDALVNDFGLLPEPRTALQNSKTSYNTAYDNLMTSINSAILDGKTSDLEKEDVDIKFSLYRNAIGLLNIKFEEATRAIEKEVARVIAEAEAGGVLTESMAFTQEYANRKIDQSPTPPVAPELDDLWIDVSKTPHMWKRYDGVTWVPASVTSLEELAGLLQAAQIAVGAINNTHIEPLTIDTGSIKVGAITEATIAALAITSAKLADNAVTNAKIQNDAITALKIAAGEVKEAQLAVDAVTSLKIANNAVTVGKILDGAVAEAKLAAGAVTELKIGNGAITNTKLAALAVDAAKLATGAVTNSKLATDSVSNSKIELGAVTNSKIADLAILAGKLADGSIIDTKIALGAVTNAKLAALSVDAAKLADGAVTEAKIGLGAITNTKLGALSIDAAKLQDGIITDTKLANLAVTAAKLATGSVTDTKIGTGAVTSTKILDGAIAEAKLAAGSVTELKIGTGAITNTKLAALAVDAAKLADSSVTSTKIANLAVGNAAIANGAITNAKITDLDASKITAGLINAARVQIGAGTTYSPGYDPATKETPEGAQAKADLAEEAANFYSKVTSGVNLIKDMFNPTNTAPDYVEDIIGMPDGTNGRAIKRTAVNGSITQLGYNVDVDPRKAYLMEAWVRSEDTNSSYYLGREEFTAEGLDNDIGNGPYGVAARTPLASEIGKWVKHYFLIPPHDAGLPDDHGTPQSSLTPDLENKFWNASTARIKFKIYLSYGTTTVPSTQYIANVGIYEVGSDSHIYAAKERVDLWSYADTTYFDGGQIYTNSVTANQIAAGTITANEIAANTITSAKMLAGTITAASGILADASITTAKIANLAVGSAAIANGAIIAAKIGTAAIGTAAIGDAAITNAKLDRASVNKIVIGTADITDASITSAKIGALAVGNAAIANGAITNAKIGLLAVDTAQIANAAIQAAQIEALAVGTAAIQNAAITNAKIGLLAVGTAQITDAAITSAKIANLAVGNAAIANAAITDAKIANLDAAKITTGLLNAARVQIGTGTTFDAGFDPTTKATPEYVSSRGESLVTNGSGLLGDNTNFSSFVFDGSVANSSSGSFKKVSAGTVFNDEYMPINPELNYKLSMQAKTLGGLGRYYAMLATFDVDDLLISAPHHMFKPNTLTTLAAELKNGDTVVKLTNAANWDNTGTIDVNTHLRSIILWNYKNSFGYQYPPETYSRNWTGNAWNPGAIDLATNTITLKVPWAGGTIPIGTSLSNGSSGGSYKYMAMVGTLVPTTWTEYAANMSGVDYSGGNSTTKFSPGSAKAKIGWLMNYQSSGETIWITNLSLAIDVETVAGSKAYADGVVAPANTRIALWQYTNTTFLDGGKIYTNSITANQIAVGTITAAEIAANTITAAKIAANTITATQIATDTIVAGNIAAGAITASELAVNSVTAASMLAGTITATQIATDTITGNKIAANTITASEIAVGTITAAEIAALTITAAQIAANTITAAKIAVGTITANELAANSVTASEIAANAVIAGKIAADAVTATTIATGAVTADAIAAGSITSNMIATIGLDAGVIKAGTIATNVLFAGQLVAATGTFVGNMTAGSISSNTTINITTDATVGRKLTLRHGTAVSSAEGMLEFVNSSTGVASAQIYVSGGTSLTMSSNNHIGILGNSIDLMSVNGKVTINHLQVDYDATFLGATNFTNATITGLDASDITGLSSASVNYASSAGNASTLGGLSSGNFSQSGHDHGSAYIKPYTGQNLQLWRSGTSIRVYDMAARQYTQITGSTGTF